MNTTQHNREQIYQELTKIFHSVFDNDSLQLSDTTTAKDVAEWDSLNHINLVVAVEQKFRIKFNTAEVARMANVGEFVNSILRKLDT